MRVVLDTNIFISAFVIPKSLAEKAVSSLFHRSVYARRRFPCKKQDLTLCTHTSCFRTYVPLYELKKQGVHGNIVSPAIDSYRRMVT